MPKANSPTLASPAGSPPVRSLRILYADDMAELREIMSHVLEQEGHHIETVSDGSEALERLKQSLDTFDLLITDHHMPRLNGLELVRQTRQLSYPGKIVVFSSELSERVHEQYRQFAVDAVLAKPIFPLTFRAVLEQLFAAAPASAEPEHSAAPRAEAHG